MTTHFDKPTYTVRKTRKKEIPQGVYTKDPATGEAVFTKEIEDNQMVVPKSGYHFPIGARERIRHLVDPGTWTETAAGVRSGDPLQFVDSAPYPARIKKYEKESGLPEAVITGSGKIHGIEVSLAVMDFRFCGGTLGSAAGEKITRAIESAVKRRCPCIIFSTSGGARMQEGILSLMQMAKTSAALGRLAEAKLPYLSVLTHPTTGGVSASFATLGDVILAEPGALIGFAGPRVIKDTTKQTLPPGFQTSEFLLKHGLIDQIVSRLEMRDRLRDLLLALHVRKSPPPGKTDAGGVTAMVRDEPPPGAGVTDYLFSLKPRGSKLGLDRMRLLADEIGHPERGLPVVHVAGTNGKGSVAAMLESILRAAGWRTGLYTSPHLVHLGERVQVDRRPLADTEIAAFVRELDPAADRVAASSGAEDRPSFFEFMTAMAFLQFARRRCEIGVIETGLGGQFDATNIVMPEVSVITSIGLDHCEWLGPTIAQIATAKAGIIKAGRPVVLGRMPAEAERIMRDTAAQRAAPVVSVREIFGDDVNRCPVTNLEGDYQRWNAATATLAARALAPHWRVTDAAIARGLTGVIWAGRWDRRRIGGRTVILDASHNPEGAAELDRNLARLVAETGRRPWVLTGVLGAERAGPLLAAISRHARHISLTVPRQPRACTHEELERLIPAGFAAAGGRVDRATVEAAFPGGDNCALGGPDDVVVVTGSIYLLGEVMARLEPAAADGR